MSKQTEYERALADAHRQATVYGDVEIGRVARAFIKADRVVQEAKCQPKQWTNPGLLQALADLNGPLT